MTALPSFVTGSILVSIAYLAVLGVATLVAALRAGGRREDTGDPTDALAASRLTMPVSIIVPAAASSRTGELVERLLGLTYPDFEVIVIVDAGAAVIDALVGEWRLEAREFFYRRTLETAPVKRIFKSLRDARLMVVEKEAAHRSDALNCGVDLARFRFVAVVPPAIDFDDTALLRAIAPVMRDPVSIVGVVNPLERVPRSASSTRGGRFQRLRSIRMLMRNSLFWARQRRALGVEDAVVIWRRDAVVQANGFSSAVADADLDMMFRLQNGFSGEARRVVNHDEVFGRMDVVPPATARMLARTRQRAVLQTIGTWAPVVSKAAGRRAFTRFLDAELVAPLAQGWIVLATGLGALANWYSWTAVVCSLLLLCFGNAAMSAAALLVRGSQPLAPNRQEMRALLLIAPLEVLLYQPARAWARVTAFFGAGSTG
ncbi:MAG: glycosyltransferase family 2 protein [Vicinamibacterales bacterium]